MGEIMNGYRLLVGRPEGKRPLRIPKGMLADNIKMYLVDIGWRREATGLVWLKTGKSGKFLRMR
jgi:hypothetical protein